MTEDTTNLVLEHLRRIRASVEKIEEELIDVKLRLSAVEQGQGLITAGLAQLQVSMSSFQRRADRIDMRNDSVESRLERLEGSKDATEERLTRIEERLKKIDA